MVERWSSDKETGGKDELRSYENKDYSEDIQFPVELVDRDGVVRRYSYEESLAVYHRRIQSAPWRLEDSEVVQAEIGHCSRRIDQIRRSFKAQLGQPGSQRHHDNPRAILGEGFDILTAFYEKVLQRRQLSLDGGLEMSVALVQDEADSRLYHLSFGSQQGGHLLYVFPFEKPGDQDPRAAWREATHRFRRYSGSQVERLLLAAHGESAGYVLTGSEEIPRGLKARIRIHDSVDEGVPIEFEEAPTEGGGIQPWWAADLPVNDSTPEWGEAFDLGMAALGKDQLTQALSMFQKAVEENPFHREAYLAVLGVLDTMSNYDEADMYAEMALAQLPDDGLIRYRTAILHVRQWRHDEALAAFDEAVRLEPSLYQAAFFASHLMLARLQDLDGATQRLRLASALSEQDPQVLRCLRAAEACRAARRLVRSVAVVAAVPAVGAVVLGRSALGVVVLTASLVALLSAGKLAALVARWAVRRASLLIDDPA